jgi:hypothetical protein
MARDMEKKREYNRKYYQEHREKWYEHHIEHREEKHEYNYKYYQEHRNILRARSQERQTQNPEKVHDRNHKYYQGEELIRACEYRTENPERVRESSCKSHRKQRGAKQGACRPRPEVCETCGVRPGGKVLHFDHDHVTGAFRGWLCHHCNVALGMVKDNPTTLRALAVYLENGGLDGSAVAA